MPASNESESLVWSGELGLAEVEQLDGVLLKELSRSDYFCLWLEGSLGAGKTAAAGRILHGLGLDRRSRVCSPTYALRQDYIIAARRFTHLDLYRLADGCDTATLDLAIEEADGYLVEWPERLSRDGSSDLAPTHRLQIAPAAAGAKRAYRFWRCGQPGLPMPLVPESLQQLPGDEAK